MKKSLSRILSVTLSVCILLTMVSVCIVASAYTALKEVELVVDTDSDTGTVDKNGNFNVVVSLNDYDDCIANNKVLGAAVINITYDSALVTPDIDTLSTYDGLSNFTSVSANDGVLTFVLNGDNSSYITKAQLDANNGKLFSLTFNANNVDGKALFGIAIGSNASATSLAVLDLDVAAGADGALITNAAVTGIGNNVSVQIGDGSYVYEPKNITVTMVDANGVNGYWYAPDSNGPFYVSDKIVFNTANVKINLDGASVEPWNAYFTLTGGTGSGNSDGNIKLYNGAYGAVITLDKPGVWNLTFSNNNITYNLMSITVYPTPLKEDVEAAEAFDETAKNLPAASSVTLDNETQIVAAHDEYEALTAAGKTLVTEYEKYIETYEAYLTLKYGSVGRAMAYDVIVIINELPEPGDITLDDANAIDFARTKYTLLNDNYKQYVENYKKLVADESALDAIYVPKQIVYKPGDTSATSTQYVNFSETTIYVSDSLKNGAWWKDYTYNYTDSTTGTTYTGKIYNATLKCESANISQSVQVGFGKSNGGNDTPYILTAAGVWSIYGTIEDSTNGNKTILLAEFTVLPTPYGNEDNAAAADITSRINALPNVIKFADVETVEQLKADYDALVRYDLITSDDVAKLNAAVAAAERAKNLTCDVSGNGVVDSADMLIIQQMIIGQTEMVSGADIDGNGKLSSIDLLLLQQHILGYSLLF